MLPGADKGQAVESGDTQLDMDRRSSASVDNIYFRQHNGEVPPAAHAAEAGISPRQRLSSDHQNHLAPPPMRRSTRRRGSGGSEASAGERLSQMGDNISTFSGGSLAYYYRVCDDTDESLPCLVLSRLEKIPLKDFSSEIRANLDIDKFVKEAVLLLDAEGNNLEDIIEGMIQRIFSDPDAVDETQDIDLLISEAKRALFMQASCLSHTYQRLSKTIRGISVTENEGLTTDQSWLCAMCSMASVHRRYVAIARLNCPVNLGRSSEGVYFILLVISPTKEKGTKSEIELGRTFSTILSDMEFRQQLLFAETSEEFREMLHSHARELAEEQKLYRRRSLKIKEVMNQVFAYETKWWLANGIRSDLKKRIPAYPSDFSDGIRGTGTVRKLISTTSFLYFACLLPSIAFGALNDYNTNGQIGVQRVIISQTIGGLIFFVFGGQPLIVLLTTAPLALYTKVIYSICTETGVEFFAMLGCVGVFNSIFLFMYALFDLSKLMKWSTRSTEEIFAFFVSIAFFTDAAKGITREFNLHYIQCSNNASSNTFTNQNFNLSVLNLSNTDFLNQTGVDLPMCKKEVSLLYLLLTIGTVWMAIYLFNFTKTPFLNTSKRELMADFALPVSVITMSFLGSFIFRDIDYRPFSYRSDSFRMEVVPFASLTWGGVLGALGLAFPLSLLFFMDQNISSAMVNCPSNKLKKGSSYHWDLLIIALINCGLSIFGLPWIHGALPHSPLHVKALSDLEERIDLGHHVHQTIVRVRETRLTGIISHIFIGLSLLMLPMPLSYIPPSVLDGLFIYMAITALYDNQMFERILLLVTEQAAYPPSHYLRRVPQRKVHIFTLLQLSQLGLMCLLGFAPTPYMKMGFPILLMLQMPIRHLILPKVIAEKYLDALDKSF